VTSGPNEQLAVQDAVAARKSGRGAKSDATVVAAELDGASEGPAACGDSGDTARAALPVIRLVKAIVTERFRIRRSDIA